MTRRQHSSNDNSSQLPENVHEIQGRYVQTNTHMEVLHPQSGLIETVVQATIVGNTQPEIYITCVTTFGENFRNRVEEMGIFVAELRLTVDLLMMCVNHNTRQNIVDQFRNTRPDNLDFELATHIV
jgi:hypothetical protein